MYFTIKLIRFCVRLVLWPFRLTLSLLSAVLGAVPGVTGGGGIGDAGGEWSPKRFVWILYGLAAFQLHGAYLALANETIYGLDRTRSILYASPIVDYGYVVFLFPSDSDGVLLLWGLGFLGYAAAYGYVGRQVSTEGRLSPSLRKKSRAFFAANAVGFVILPAMYGRAVMSEFDATHLTYGEFYDGTGASLLGYALLMGGLYVYADRVAGPSALPDRPQSTSTASASSAADGEASPASTADGSSNARSDSSGSSSGPDDGSESPGSPTASSESATDSSDSAAADSTPPVAAAADGASTAGDGDSTTAAAGDAATTTDGASSTTGDVATTADDSATTTDDAATTTEDAATADGDTATTDGDSSTGDGATELTYSSDADAEATERAESTIDPLVDGLTADDAAARESAIDSLRRRASTDPASLAGELESLRTALERTADRDVKVAVVEVLAELDDPAATDALERLRLDPDQAVSDAACRVLRDA